MTKGPRVYLLHIFEAIEAIEKNLEGITEEQFNESDLLSSFVERKLEIIGEAAKRISDEFKKQHSDVPWKKMSATRNVLIHKYDDVDSAIVWDTATQHLLPLKTQVEKILQKVKTG